MEFIQANWQMIAYILGGWALVAGIINKSVWPKPAAPPASKVVVVLHAMLIDGPALLPSLNMKGWFGLPFNVPFLSLSVQPKQPADDTDPKPPTLPPAAAWLPFLLAGSLLVSVPGCATVKQIAFDCGLPATISLVKQIMFEVVAALAQDNWSGLLDDIVTDLKSDGVADAVDVVMCALKNFTQNMGRTRSVMAGQKMIAMRNRAQMWIAIHQAKAMQMKHACIGGAARAAADNHKRALAAHADGLIKVVQ